MTKQWTVEEAVELVHSARTLRSWGREQDALDTAQAAYDTLRAAKDQTTYRIEAAEILASLYLAAGDVARADALAGDREDLNGIVAPMERLRARIASQCGRNAVVLEITSRIQANLGHESADLWENLEALRWLERAGEIAAAEAFRKAWIDVALENIGSLLSYHPEAASIVVPVAGVLESAIDRLMEIRETLRAAFFQGEGRSGPEWERTKRATDEYVDLLRLVPSRDPKKAAHLCATVARHLGEVPTQFRAAIRADLARILEVTGDHAAARAHWRDAYGYLVRLRGLAPEDPLVVRAHEGLVRTRRALGVPMEHEEATAIVAPEVWRAFPDRARRMMLEIQGWFAGAEPPQSRVERSCSFCCRSLEWAQAASSFSDKAGVADDDPDAWVSLCSACRHLLREELADKDAGPRPQTDAVLSDVDRVLRSSSSPDAADALIALRARAVSARVAPEGPCSLHPTGGEALRVWCGPHHRACESCVSGAGILVF
jgi:hypothetical protein